MRDAPSRTLMEALWLSGVIVRAYDPVAMKEAGRIYGEHTGLTLCNDQYTALQGADALVICTEAQQFRLPDFDEMTTRICRKVIVDGRNLYQLDKLQDEGWTYFSVGRAAISSATTHLSKLKDVGEK